MSGSPAAGSGAGAAGVWGTSGSGVSGGSGTSAPIGDACASVRVDAKLDIRPGNLLVIFDRSLTMNDPFDTPSGPQPKYIAAGASLVDTLAPLACPRPADPAKPCTDSLTVGAIIFPTLATCSVDPIESAEQIDFRPAGEFIDAWGAYWMTRTLIFSTPFNAAFTQGDAALQRMDLVGNKAVLFFTDGESFCDDGLVAPQLATEWASAGIKTYVVGLPGATGVKILQDTAAAGGTATYITPSDSAVLAHGLQKIVVETAGFESCTFSIDGRIVDEALACRDGVVSIDGTRVLCDAAHGFSVDEATHITFHGDACTRLMASAGRLDATFPCNVVVPD